MSKKDYIAIADALRPFAAIAAAADTNEPLDLGYQRATEQILGALAKAFACDNSRFDAGRWFDYLNGLRGPNGGAVKAR